MKKGRKIWPILFMLCSFSLFDFECTNVGVTLWYSVHADDVSFALCVLIRCD